MKRIFISVVLVFLAIGLTGSYSTPSYSVGKLGIAKNNSLFNYMPGEDITKEFNVEKGQTLLIDLETGGEIAIVGWDQNIVNVSAMISGRDAEDVEIEFDQNSDGVEIYSDYNSRRRNRSCNIRLEIKVPKVFNLDLETSGGEIELDGIEGDIEGKTMGGALDLKNLKGKIDINTMGGSIDVYNCEANGKVKTMGDRGRCCWPLLILSRISMSSESSPTTAILRGAWPWSGRLPTTSRSRLKLGWNGGRTNWN